MLIQYSEIDLTEPLQPIYVDERYGKLSVLVRWGLIPLEMLSFGCQPHSRTIEVEQLQQGILQALGWQVWERAIAGTLQPALPEELPPISVVVCTRDRPLSLENCLQALSQLDYPTYEVVVVDNCSQDPEVAEVIKRYGFRYVREDRPGLDWARNRGMQEAKYDIIAYTDDDALAAPLWLRGMALGFAQPEVMAVTGMVLPAEVETSAQYDFECYGGMSKGCISYNLKRRELSDRDLFWASSWGVGANMAFRRELFEAIGGFDVALDVGTPTCGGGDIEFFYRTVAAGYTLRYEAAATVRHVHRRDQATFRRQIYNNGRSFAAYLLTIARNEPHQRQAVFWFALRWWIWSWLLQRLLVSIWKRDRWTFRLASTEIWGSCSALGAYRKSQQRALQLQVEAPLNQLQVRYATAQPD